jgi:hypothetical protein
VVGVEEVLEQELVARGGRGEVIAAGSSEPFPVRVGEEPYEPGL